jgi:hypothetical protein
MTMKNDSLMQVLAAATEKRTIYGGNPKTSFTVTAHADLKPQDAPKIRQLQEYFRRAYKIETPVVGGGWGCTQIIFDSGDEGTLRITAEAFATDSKLQELLRNIFGPNYRVSLPNSPYSIDGNDYRAILEAMEAMPPPPKLSKSKSVTSQNSGGALTVPVVPDYDELRTLVEALHRGFSKNEVLLTKKEVLTDYEGFADVEKAVDALGRHSQNGGIETDDLQSHIKAFEDFSSYCKQMRVYPTTVKVLNMLVVQLRAILQTANPHSKVSW